MDMTVTGNAPTATNGWDGWLLRKTAVHLSPAALILLSIVGLSAGLHFYQLSAIGDANLYYTAAVKSMLQSWHNFFFIAAEPGASVTIDKPPLGLWIEAASAAIFGVNGFAVALPNILAGLLSVPLIYAIVKKYYGAGAGLIAALVIAVTPVSIAAGRNNTMDGLLVLTLILAAWAFLRATETNRLRFLWLGALLVGVGFNIKMMQVLLPVPAFYAVYFLGAKTAVWRKIINLALATALIIVVSLSWAMAVDMTPADQRPYIGSSADNSVMELIMGHNGINRWQAGGGNGPQAPQNAPRFPPPNDGQSFNNGGAPPPNDGRQPPNDGGQPPIRFDETGEAGILRFFRAPLSKEMSWLLPFALAAAIITLFSHKLRWPLAPQHRMLVLWGGWLLTCLIFFSFANLFHAYYMIMLAPPLAVLVGMGAAELWQMRQTRARLAVGLLTAVAAVTFFFQWYNVAQFISPIPLWLLFAGGLLLVGMGVLWWSWLVEADGRWQPLSLALVIAALLITPLIWSGLTTLDSNNVNLPGAYAGKSDAPFSNDAKREADPQLLAYLQANTQDTAYLMAVPSSMQGAEYVLATGRPVLYMGGFSGNDPVVDADDIARLVADGDLRYVMIGDNGRGNQREINEWVRNNCNPAEGAVDERPSQGNRPPSPGGQNSVLYACTVQG